MPIPIIYIRSARQISVQQPLTDDWFDSPILHRDVTAVRSLDPNFSEHIPPLVARRMCTLLRRAVVLSRLALRDASLEQPDAIISGTGLGCIQNTERFLHAIHDNGEQYLQPTYFMQSTHNIISATIAIDLKCHAYNTTYVHRGTSFENALLDALLRLRSGDICNALVGGFDELTDDYLQFFRRTGRWQFTPAGFAGEAAVSLLLNGQQDANTLCRLDDLRLLYRPTPDQLRASLHDLLTANSCSLDDIDAVLIGLNTNPDNDRVYLDAAAPWLYPGIPLIHYKHLFGESFSASALAHYVAATCLRRGHIPSHLRLDGSATSLPARRILIHNHSMNKTHTLTLLTAC